MRFSNILPCIVAAAAWVIPEGQPDGVYQVSIAANGTEIHTRIGDVSDKKAFAIRGSTPADDVSALSKRQSSVICDPKEAVLVTNDNGAAATSTANWCGNGNSLNPNIDIYTVVGCSVAYICNLSGSVPYSCTTSSIWTIFNHVSDVCGYDVPGWQVDPGFWQVGYQWFCTYPGSSFCSNH